MQLAAQRYLLYTQVTNYSPFPSQINWVVLISGWAWLSILSADILASQGTMVHHMEYQDPSRRFSGIPLAVSVVDRSRTRSWDCPLLGAIGGLVSSHPHVDHVSKSRQTAMRGPCERPLSERTVPTHIRRTRWDRQSSLSDVASLPYQNQQITHATRWYQKA